MEDRTVRLTPNSADIASAMLSKDGETLYYLASFEGGYDLWKRKLRKGDTKIVNKLDGRGMGMEMDDDGNIYLIGSSIKKFDPKSEKLKNVSFSTNMKLDPAKEREYMLKYVYNEEKQRFYHPGMHGVDWDKMYADYAKFLPHINNNNDFAELLSELLGELNVSHTGGSYRGNGASHPTASLGLLYDMTYAGPGMKVEEVIEKGPFDRASTKLKAGAVITKINGVELKADSDPLAVLNDLARKKTLVTFKNADGSVEEEVVLPITSGAMSGLLYDRWVKQREKDVDRMSGGRLGYVHIRSMNDDSFRRIYAKMLGE